MKRSLFALILFQVAQLQSAFSYNTFSEHVIGRVVLTPIEATSAPFKWVGVLKRPDLGYCTVNVVAPDLVLTAAHCVVDKNNMQPNYGIYKIEFPEMGELHVNLSKENLFLDFTKNDIYTFSIAKKNASSILHGKDYAFIRLDRPLDESYGHFDLNLIGDYLLNGSTHILAGYGIDGNGKFTAISGCSLKKVNPTMIYHNCDSSPGDSGGAIFRFDSGNGRWVIDAITIAEIVDVVTGQRFLKAQYSEATANMSVPSSNMVNMFNSLSSIKYKPVTPYGGTVPSIRKDPSSKVRGVFEKKFPSSKTGMMCFVYCSQNEERIPVTLMNFKDVTSVIDSAEKCEEKANLVCNEKLKR